MGAETATTADRRSAAHMVGGAALKLPSSNGLSCKQQSRGAGKRGITVVTEVYQCWYRYKIFNRVTFLARNFEKKITRCDEKNFITDSYPAKDKHLL